MMHSRQMPEFEIYIDTQTQKLRNYTGISYEKNAIGPINYKHCGSLPIPRTEDS